MAGNRSWCVVLHVEVDPVENQAMCDFTNYWVCINHQVKNPPNPFLQSGE
jgi:hypothetical protein